MASDIRSRLTPLDENGKALVHNYVFDQAAHQNLPQKVIFWDETLRDGEQTPGLFFTVEEKVEIAKMLDDLGVGIMDVGIPVVSPKEFEACKAIAREGTHNAVILAAARAVKRDIDACVDAGAEETSIFIAVSDLHLKYKLKMTREQCLNAAVESIEYAKERGIERCFVTEDTVRADLEFVAELYNAAIGAGAKRAVICDTVGVCTPSTAKWFVREFKKRVKPVQLSWHGHNDFGMAVANTLAALEEGVEIPHGCVNGIGERAGNASLEEMIMALEVLYGKETGIKIEKVFEVSKRIEELTGIPLAAQKPLVGTNAYSHESGIHTHGILKHTLTYEPIMPEMIGRKREFVFGKHTGTTSVEEKLKDNAVDFKPEQVQKLTELIKEVAEGKTKADYREYIRSHHEHEHLRRGVSDGEFWQLAAKVGLKPRL
ncbi:MAG TPA: homoaconitate hydratase [Candidatus Thermoplasmatota archaeon]|nr:homoaconitate hydratase [Candidatus Thermoplasmatota archaeon]